MALLRKHIKPGTTADHLAEVETAIERLINPPKKRYHYPKRKMPLAPSSASLLARCYRAGGVLQVTGSLFDAIRLEKAQLGMLHMPFRSTDPSTLELTAQGRAFCKDYKL